MPKTFIVKMPPGPAARAGKYIIVTCPRCGKKTYGVVGQTGKKCPVCRRQFLMPVNEASSRFRTPEEACRFIQTEEAGRAGRMDFAPVTGGFRPASSIPIVARTDKVITNAHTLDSQFATWVRAFFSSITEENRAGVPTTVVIAAATKAGFSGADVLIEMAITAHVLARPKPYAIQLADRAL